MNEDIIGKTILEPSAGKGDIVDWLKEHGANVIACENDPTLRKLLDGKCEIIADDFLTVTAEQVSHIDYIVMNPPFSQGAKHINHAFEIAPTGCTIIALCNDDNLHIGYYHSRNQYKEKLIETVELYGQKEYLGEVFDTAERRTNVGVTLIKLYKEGSDENEFEGYFFSKYDEDLANINEKEGIMHYNLVRDLVNRYVSAVKLFDETLAAANKINEVAQFPDDDIRDYVPIKFGTIKTNNGYDKSATEISHQEYKKALQKYYWRIIFHKLHMEKYATKQLREQINKFTEQQQNVPFTMANIYRVIDIVIQTNGNRMNTALLEAFDLICSFSAENSTAGEKWKTNANYMVNRKFIVNWICNGYDTAYEGTCSWSMRKKRVGKPTVEFDHYHLEQMEDITKALCFITERNYDWIEPLGSHSKKEQWGEWFQWGFFRCKGFKKGTMHFEFLDEDVWMKFNQKVASLRGWQLPKKSEERKTA